MTATDKINKAFDSWSANSTLVHLSVKEADMFIDYVIDESTILKEARVKRMTKPKENIDKVGIGSDVLHPATRGTALSSTKYTEATTGSIQLDAQEVIAVVKINDDELEDNIEGDAFKDHMMRMVANKAQNQLERSGLYGRKLVGATDTDHLFDWWITRILAGGNVVDANSFSDRYISKEKLAAVYKSIPTKFEWMLDRIYMPNGLIVDYEVLYEASQNRVSMNSAFNIPFAKAPGIKSNRPFAISGVNTTTTAGTTANGTNNTIAVTSATNINPWTVLVLGLGTANEQVVTVLSVASLVVTLTAPVAIDVLSGATVKTCALNGADVLITPKNNLIRGVQRSMTVELERSARERATYFVMTMGCDFQVEEVTASGILYNALVK